MYLITAGLFPACGEISGDRIQAAITGRGLRIQVSHVYLQESNGWWLVGLYVDGSPADACEDDLEAIRAALATFLPADGSVLRVEVAGDDGLSLVPGRDD